MGFLTMSALAPYVSWAKRFQVTKHFMIYIGTYTSGKSEGIYVYKLNADTGDLTRLSTAKGIQNPSFLTLDPQKRFLFAVNEVTDFEGKPSGSISAFAVDQKTGALTFLNKQPSLGGAPCYVSVDKNSKFALVANYVGGNASVFPIEANGQLKPASDMVQHTGHGLNPDRQERPHVHSIVLDPANKFAFVCDLGIDKVMSYVFDANSGKLKLNQPVSFNTKPGAGPRHFVFHSSGKFAYVINELNSTIVALAYDATKGLLTELQTVSALPAGYTGESYCADIHISPNGKFLYGSNRGHNSIVVYAIDTTSGKLTLVEHVNTQGNWPRNFGMDPSGKFMLVANERTHSIVVFKVSSESGKLTPTGKSVEIPSPVCVHIIPSFS